MNQFEKQVREFHAHFGATVGDARNPGLNESALRKNLLLQEVDEFIHAVEWGDFDGSIRELLDILYVTIGALVAFGVEDIASYFSELHEANMRKEGGSTREDRKIVKPEGWQPPHIGRLIEAQRLRGEGSDPAKPVTGKPVTTKPVTTKPTKPRKEGASVSTENNPG